MQLNANNLNLIYYKRIEIQIDIVVDLTVPSAFYMKYLNVLKEVNYPCNRTWFCQPKRIMIDELTHFQLIFPLIIKFLGI